MRDALKAFASGLTEREGDEGEDGRRLGSLRAAAAQLLIAATAEVVLERFGARGAPDISRARRPLTFAPLIVAPLTAAAHLEHARNPREATSVALRFLNATSIILGGALVVMELLDESRPVTRIAPLTLTSAGLLGLALDSEETKLARDRRDLLRRADMVERLVPKRRPKLDRIVVHV